MAKIGQIRGALLEEVLLYLLRASGYQTVETADDDETIQPGTSGLELLGRGGVHQIDAIADFVISPPFSNPQRLLIEAKCFTPRNGRKNAVGIEVVRNAVGVLKDLEEYWVSREGLPKKERYHYQYALFSATEYTEPAQKYAYAHDVYLIPLEDSTFIKPIVEKIQSLDKESFGADSNNKIPVNPREFRLAFRELLRSDDEIFNNYPDFFRRASLRIRLREMQASAQRVNHALVGMISKRFPVFLIPDERTNVRELAFSSPHQTRIFWNESGWRLESSPDNNLEFEFSFDLPVALFKLYAEQDLLSPRRAIDMKTQHMKFFEAVFIDNGEPRVIRFETDRDWLERLQRSQPFLRESTT